MTQTQMDKVLEVDTYAQIASGRATSEVLARLDDPSFRAALANYSSESISLASAVDILNDLRAAAEVAEFVHGFPSSLKAPHAYSPAVDLELLRNKSYLPSMWQLV